MSYYPDIHQLLEQPGDELFKTNRSLYSILSGIFLCLFAAVIVRLLDFISIRLDFAIIEHFSLKWLYIVPLGILVEIFRRRHDELYTFSRETVTQHQGRLSLAMSVPVVRYEDIRAVTIRQDIVGRLFAYGDVWVNTASTAEEEVVLRGVRYPQELGYLLESLQIIELKKANKVASHNPYLKEYKEGVKEEPEETTEDTENT